MHRFVTIGLAASLILGAGSVASDAAAPLAKFTIKSGGIPASLTGRPGDAQKGRQVVLDRERGNCVACHAITAIRDAHSGNVGPSLDGVAGRLTEAQLRLRIIDASKLNPKTVMPPYYRVDELHKVLHKFQGQPILTAAQVEDVVAFLETLK